MIQLSGSNVGDSKDSISFNNSKDISRKVRYEFKYFKVEELLVFFLGALFGPAYQSIIKYIVPEDKLQQSNSYLGMKSALQNILAMLVAGVMYSADIYDFHICR